MTRFLWEHVRGRRGRSASLAAGIVVAAVGFTLLTATVNTGQLRVRGTIQRNFRLPYDLLVRPQGSVTAVENEQGLVAANFSSAIFGGITREQWQEVLHVPGVEVAAPIANLGYIAPFASVEMRINRFLNDDDVQLYRLRATWSADRSLSSYRGNDSFIYFTRVNPIVVPRYGYLLEELSSGERLEVCFGFNRSNPPVADNPYSFSTREGWIFQCFSEQSPRAAKANVVPFTAGGVGSGVDFTYPMLVAGISPVQEDRLLQLNDSIVSGRPLSNADKVAQIGGEQVIPMLVSSRPFVDQSIDVAIERQTIPDGVDVPRTLASLRAFAFVTGLDGQVQVRLHVSAGALYRQQVKKLERTGGGLQNYWSVSGVQYQPTDEGELRPVPTTNPQDAYELPCCGPTAGPGNQDVQFRVLQNHQVAADTPPFRFRFVGRFDPSLLPGFGNPSQIPLGAYAPPILEPADSQSRDALGDRSLLPSMNLGGYIQQPPFLLTSLRGLRFFTNHFEGSDPRAPISVIRVRVAGVTGPDDLSMARLRSAAQLIRQRTGLAVDIAAGSSPTPMLVQLPAGDNGRPPLLLSERWVRKGVAIQIVRALDRKSLFLFLLVLLVSAFFLANGAFASVRSRRTEIGTLACLGWSQGRIFAAILAELGLIGLCAGLIGTALALAVIGAFSLRMPVGQALLVAPVAVVLACAAGLAPAWRASRIEPVEALRSPISRRASSASIGRLASMAFVNLRRLPGRTVVGACGLFIGVAALTVLIAINLVFQGALVGSLLGNVISVQVREVDVLSVGLALALSALSVADVLMLNIRDRAAELVTLRATGWGDSRLGELVALEGLGLGLLGSIPGALVGVAFAWAVGGISYQAVVAGAVAATMAIGVALAASLLPAAFVSRMLASVALAEE